MRGRFGDLITAMATPFDADNRVDLGQARRLAAWLVDHGSDGLVVTGSTGEASTLTDDEKVALWAAVVEEVGDRASVIAGSGTYDTAHSVALTRRAEAAGCHAALVVTPYYNRPPQSGLSAHFRAVADATALPVILYDIPSRTGRKIEHRTIIELAGVANVVGVKDACGDLQGAARLVAEAPAEFQVWCGNDGDTLGWLAVGAVGVISVASHLVGPQMNEMITAHKAGDVHAALKIHLGLMPVFDVLGLTTNPIPIKAALELLGHPVGSPRLPLPPATPEEVATIRRVLERAGVA
ncbi:MAG: 4-hydroxy-tetrahydrodipicolinate synthase [Actinomycetota bacterium]